MNPSAKPSPLSLGLSLWLLLSPPLLLPLLPPPSPDDGSAGCAGGNDAVAPAAAGAWSLSPSATSANPFWSGTSMQDRLAR